MCTVSLYSHRQNQHRGEWPVAPWGSWHGTSFIYGDPTGARLYSRSRRFHPRSSVEKRLACDRRVLFVARLRGLESVYIPLPFDPLHLHLRLSSMPTLPFELIEDIIDIVAQCSPESLTNCALVSHHWNPRSTHHVGRIFRTPTVSTFDALHAFLNIVQKHPRLAALTTSLEVIPVPEFRSAFASYVPFHHLSSYVFPNVHRLILGETLRWSDYPLLYRNGTVGFTFHRVTALDFSCHFNSISDLLYAIQSFRNVEDVRLIYPHHDPPRWMFSDHTHTPLKRGPFFRKTFKLQSLELSLAIAAAVLDVCGDFVVNLSIVCPEMSAVSMDVSDGKRLPFACSLTLLQTVKITVPVDSDDPTHHAGLGKLRYLVLAPITKPNIRYSLFLVRCREHNAVGYRVEGISVTQLWWIIRTSAGMDRLDGCQECEKRVVAAPVPKDTTGASSGLEVTAQNTSYRSGHWRGQLNNYIQRNGLQRQQSNIYWGTPQQVGPRHMPTWTISVFFNHIEYGRGSATRLDIAKETAAEQALKTLWGERGA